MKKLGVVITDGVGFRNFILSDFIVEAQKTFGEVVIYSCLPVSAYENCGFSCRIVALGEYAESFPTWFFRKAKEVAHLRRHRDDNFGIRDIYQNNRTSAKNPRGYATRFIFRLVERLHSEKWIVRFDALQRFSSRNDPDAKQFGRQIAADGIDLIFFTHQRPPFIAPLVHQAGKAGIPTAAFIFSWDNLASKGRMAAHFDFFLVWSELMRAELLKFYTSVKASQIEIVGTPQFEPYVLDRFPLDRDGFFARFGLDPTRPLIVFTCNDASSTNDPLYLRDLARAVASGAVDANILVRTSPADTPERFLRFREEFPFLHWNFPDWPLLRADHSEPWTQRVPSFEDISTLKNLLAHCDVLVNVLSTTMLDVFLFGKPSICPVYGDPEEGYGVITKYLDYGHLQHVDRIGASAIPHSKEDFIRMVNESLAHPDIRQDEQRQLLDLEIGKPLEGTSARIAQTLQQWAG